MITQQLFQTVNMMEDAWLSEYSYWPVLLNIDPLELGIFIAETAKETVRTS